MQIASIDYFILIAFLAYSVSVGFFYRRRASENIQEYFLAGQTLAGWKAGLSMAATQYAADTPLLVTGMVAVAGIGSLWRLWIYAIAFLFMGFVLGACWRRSGVLTDAELTELRYSGKLAMVLRVLKAIHLGTFVNCTVLAMVLLAASRVAEPFFPWHEWLPASVFRPVEHCVQYLGFHLTSTLSDDELAWKLSASNFISLSCIVFFVWLYSATGGLRSVVETDVGQFLFMIVGTICYAAAILVSVGGISGMHSQLVTIYGSDWTSHKLSFSPIGDILDSSAVAFLAVLAVQWFAQVNSDGTGYLAQRMMGCRSERDTKIAAVVFAFAQVLLRSLIWLPIIIGLLIIYPMAGAEHSTTNEAFRVGREELFAKGIRDLLPIGMRGIMLTAMVAALASTVDTHLNWGASYWTNDLYKRFLMEYLLQRNPANRELVLVARLSNLLILAIAFIIALNLSSVQQAWHITLLLGAGLGFVLIARWLWFRINRFSEIAAIVVSAVTAPLLLLQGEDAGDPRSMLAMTAISVVCTVIVTLITSPEPLEVLERFYRRVHPPGFWSPISEMVDDSNVEPPHVRLWNSVALTIAAIITLYTMLIGFGEILTGRSSIVSYLLIAVGVGLAPLWLKYGIGSAKDTEFSGIGKPRGDKHLPVD